MTTKKKIRVSEAELERRQALSLARWEVVHMAVRIGLIGITSVAIVYFGIAVRVVASQGKETSIHYVLSVLVNADVHVVVAWSVAAAAGGWTWKERVQRMRKRKAKDERIKAIRTETRPAVRIKRAEVVRDQIRASGESKSVAV